jgi:hypothetical protein
LVAPVANLENHGQSDRGSRPGRNADHKRNPYPGRLGVVEDGALADLLLVDGNPLQDLSLVATPDTSFSVIMKDGRIYKNGPAS